MIEWYNVEYPMSNLLSTVTSSEKRKNLLIFLLSGPKTWEEIKFTLNVTATGMLPQIKILIEHGLIAQEGKIYTLTEQGEIISTYLEPLLRSIDVIESQGKFWRDHDYSVIPRHLLLRIGDLKPIKMIESSTEEIYEPHKEFLGNILKSKKLKGISPIVHPMYPEFFLTLAKNNVEIELLLTKKAFQKIEKEHREKLIEGLRHNNAHVFIAEKDIKLACVVTDVFFSMSLFFKNGIFDPKWDIVSFEPTAIEWGEKLFMHYKEQSKEITCD